jgi:hypothetical protein
MREWRMAQQFNILSLVYQRLFADRAQYSRNKHIPARLQLEVLHVFASFIPWNISNSNSYCVVWTMLLVSNKITAVFLSFSLSFFPSFFLSSDFLSSFLCLYLRIFSSSQPSIRQCINCMKYVHNSEIFVHVFKLFNLFNWLQLNLLFVLP